MKLILFAGCLISLSGCVSYQPLSKSNIKAVYVLFKDTTQTHYDGYKLYDGFIVKWDKKDIGVRTALNKYSDKLDALKQERPDYKANFLAQTKHIITYTPIKVVPFREFGYIQTTSKQLIFYGMGRNVFIDLTNNRVYY